MCSFFSILENDLIITFPACALPATNCILSALRDVCIQHEMLCCAMHGQRYLIISTFHGHRSVYFLFHIITC